MYINNERALYKYKVNRMPRSNEVIGFELYDLYMDKRYFAKLKTSGNSPSSLKIIINDNSGERLMTRDEFEILKKVLLEKLSGEELNVFKNKLKGFEHVIQNYEMGYNPPEAIVHDVGQFAGFRLKFTNFAKAYYTLFAENKLETIIEGKPRLMTREEFDEFKAIMLKELEGKELEVFQDNAARLEHIIQNFENGYEPPKVFYNRDSKTVDEIRVRKINPKKLYCARISNNDLWTIIENNKLVGMIKEEFQEFRDIISKELHDDALQAFLDKEEYFKWLSERNVRDFEPPKIFYINTDAWFSINKTDSYKRYVSRIGDHSLSTIFRGKGVVKKMTLEEFNEYKNVMLNGLDIEGLEIFKNNLEGFEKTIQKYEKERLLSEKAPETAFANIANKVAEKVKPKDEFGER